MRSNLASVVAGPELRVTEPALVELRSASVGYDGTSVLTRLDLRVERGDVLALVGPNGSGEVDPGQGRPRPGRRDGGRAEVFGRPAASVSERGRVGYVPQAVLDRRHRSDHRPGGRRCRTPLTLPAVATVRVSRPGRGRRRAGSSVFRDRGQIGYVPQRGSLSGIVPSTVQEVVAAGRLTRAGILRPFGAADRTAIHDAIDRVGLGPLAGARVLTLSGDNNDACSSPAPWPATPSCSSSTNRWPGSTTPARSSSQTP